MSDINNKYFVHQMVQEIQLAANAIRGLDPDIHEKLDEVVLAIYDQYDVSFIRCEECQSDEIAEMGITVEGKPYCRVCGKSRANACADTDEFDPVG